MLFAIFLLLYYEGVNFKVSGCLSNPHKTCSVASYQYSSACRTQLDALPPQPYMSSGYVQQQYNGFLGAAVRAKAYSERGSSSEFAKSDSEIQCKAAANCTWRNIEDDQLEWVLGEGGVDPAKMALITGSSVLPDSSFFILASDPRPENHGGILVSLPIGCQQSTGILSFRYWRSRARTLGLEPDLQVCTRKALETTLDNCLTITPTENHTIVASIPPLLEPFEIVIRGFGFENEPEGGIILVDQIDYFAHVDQPENCVEKPIDTDEIEKFPPTDDVPAKLQDEPQQTEKMVISGDAGGDENVRSLVSNEVKRSEQKKIPVEAQKDEETTEAIILSKEAEFDNNQMCRALRCLIGSLDSGCNYIRVGQSASGRGLSEGWKATTLTTNVANRLTGIHVSPQEDNESRFMTADFRGFTRDRQKEHFVLESPIFTLPEDGSDVYLGFKKYLATNGLDLRVCEDSDGKSCFWSLHQNSVEPFKRSWTTESALIPSNITKMFFLGTQDLLAKANEGQLGITHIDLYLDEHSATSLC